MIKTNRLLGHEIQSQAETSPSLINKQASVVHYLSRFLCHTWYAVLHMHLNRSQYILAINVMVWYTPFWHFFINSLDIQWNNILRRIIKNEPCLYLWTNRCNISFKKTIPTSIDVQCQLNHSVVTSKTTCPSDHQ